MCVIRLFVLAVSLFLLSSCAVNQGRVGITHSQRDVPADLYVDGALQKNNVDMEGIIRFSVAAGKHHIEVVQWGVTVLDTTVVVNGGYALAGLSVGGMVAASLMMVGAGPLLEVLFLLGGAPVGAVVSPTGMYRVNVESVQVANAPEPKWLWMKDVPVRMDYRYVDGKNFVQAAAYCYDARRDRVWMMDIKGREIFSLDRDKAAMCVENGGTFACEPSSKEMWEKLPCTGAATP